MTFLTLLITTSLLWQPSDANTCNSMYEFNLPYHVLLGHVIQSFHDTSSAESCFGKCGDNSSCHSVNWYSNTGLCQLNRGTHLSYPEGLVASDSTASYMLYSLHPMVACSNQFCSHPDICLMEDDGINYRCEGCSAPLGMQDGRITNSQITASSSYNVHHTPWRARLHYTQAAGGWAAGIQAPGQYFQVDLGKVYVISKVATQGRSTFDQWVTKYYLKYSHDGVSWESYRYGSNVKEFNGNTDRNTVVTRKLPMSIKTRFIRIVDTVWNGNNPSMRMELYGCLTP
ncbi:hypothetical protein QZH41_005738 [Actinostola sp. cb2023]|nr:hypothetical protein QZH41_005738 [Actinostola sp. cb2023]